MTLFQQRSNFRINSVNSQESFLNLFLNRFGRGRRRRDVIDLSENIRVESVVPWDGVKILVKFVQICASSESYAMFYL